MIFFQTVWLGITNTTKFSVFGEMFFSTKLKYKYYFSLIGSRYSFRFTTSLYINTIAAVRDLLGKVK